MNPYRTQEGYDTYAGDLRFAADELDATHPMLAKLKYTGTILEIILERLARDLSVQYKPPAPMIECPACSKAGGADRAVYHEAPICGEPEPPTPPAEPPPKIMFSAYSDDYGRTSISYAELIELERKEGGLFARAENSGSESYYVEVCRWNEQARRLERFAFAKAYDFRFPDAPDASDLETARLAARRINRHSDLGDLTPLVHRLPNWTGEPHGKAAAD